MLYAIGIQCVLAIFKNCSSFSLNWSVIYSGLITLSCMLNCERFRDCADGLEITGKKEQNSEAGMADTKL
jgi:hypothetical protein